MPRRSAAPPPPMPDGRPPWSGPYASVRTRAVCARDGNVCHWCGEYGNTADHVIPRRRGGPDTLDNLVCACRPCNASRGGSLGAPPRVALGPSRKW